MNNNNNIPHAFRLMPGDDLKISIEIFVKENNISAGWIAACVGSLTEYSIRFANQKNATKGSGYFEIVSLSGTISVNGSHLHICIADDTGKTTGGHLVDGCKIYTTAEIILIETPGFIFERAIDTNTSYKELKVKAR